MAKLFIGLPLAPTGLQLATAVTGRQRYPGRLGLAHKYGEFRQSALRL